MCAKLNMDICDTDDFIAALNKRRDCLPGLRGCDSFQTLFGGPYEKECLPWDLDCTLLDFLGTDGNSNEFEKYPLLAKMPKTTLTIDENNKIDE